MLASGEIQRIFHKKALAFSKTAGYNYNGLIF